MVPEPTSITLFVLGTVGLIACRYRRRKSVKLP
ncbi:MAG: PEP-CTERM sorting domain-containing protein [Acidobacteria bacterium]|nr:PEP-CTERM sorting domain-containing protein [Acidobacteriota bacterium]